MKISTCLLSFAPLGLCTSLAAGQEIKLTASDGQENAQFGQSVGICSTTIIVGAHYDDGIGTDAGSAYLFDATTGQQLKKLLASDGTSYDHFGNSVAIDGTIAVVGAWREGSNSGLDAGNGAVYLFDVDPTSPTFLTQLAKLTASDGAADDYFGVSVAISGNVAIVGAYWDDDMGSQSGSAYLFDVDPTSPTFKAQLGKLTASDGAANDYFGFSVGIDGTTAIVGALLADTAAGGGDSGCAYLFDVATGVQMAKLEASDAGYGDQFGNSVAISGTTAIVGSFVDDGTKGSAFLFDTATGVQLAKLTASGPVGGDEFGFSVGIDGNTAIVGARSTDIPSNEAGSVYLFNTTTYLQTKKLLASDGANNDRFGWSVGISGSTVAVGARWDDDMGDDSGSAYLYDWVGTRNWVQSPDTGNWIGLTESALGWHDAETLANSLGGNLLTIRSDQENSFAYQHGNGWVTGSEPYMWIGFSDEVVEGSWVWSSGDPTPYLNWGYGEPGGGSAAEDHATLVFGLWGNLVPGDWNDDFGSTKTNRGLLELTSLPWEDWLPPYHIPYAGLYGTCGDLDGDGSPEIVIPDVGAGQVRIWRNDGKGWFQPLHDIPFSNPREIQITDLDLDGDNDLVIANYTSGAGSLYTYLNDGTGTSWRWNRGGNLGGSYYSGLRCGDFNNDGYPDAVTTGFKGNVVWINVHLNDGSGDLTKPAHSTGYGITSRFVEVADLDIDGNLDFVVSHEGTHDASVFLGAGDGTFSESRLDVSGVGGSPLQIGVEDMNADGVPELIVPTSNQITIYERDPSGTYQQVSTLTPTVRPSHPLVDDFNADGILDLACAMWGGPGLEIFYGTGVLQFEGPVRKLTASGLQQIVASDVTLDGLSDIVTFGSGGSSILHNLWSIDCNGNGTPDDQDIANGTSADCNGNGVPDECDLANASFDCDRNGLIDSCEITNNPSLDCDSNGILDVCDIAADPSLDCDGYGVLDSCQLEDDPSLDCDGNDILDVCDINGDPTLDCDGYGGLDSCQLAADPSLDCDGNGRLDTCDIANDPSLDQNGDGILDSCQCAFANFCGSTANSTGVPAVLGWSGSASISAADLTLIASDVPPFQFGMFFYGSDEWFPIVMGDGLLCVAPPLYRIRTAVFSGSSGVASLNLDYGTKPLSSGAGQVAAFSTWRFQLWYRDPFSGGAGSNTTDGLMVTFCP